MSANKTPDISSLPKVVETRTTGKTKGRPNTAVIPNPAPARAAISASKVNVVPSATAVSAMPPTNPAMRMPSNFAQPSSRPMKNTTKQASPVKTTTLCRVRANMKWSGCTVVRR